METKSAMQIKHDEMREKYMSNEITHAEFYEWLASEIGLLPQDLPVSIDRVRESTDPHLNDIPLQGWDRRDPVIRGKAKRAGMQSWSLSDTVCVLKAYARKIAA